MNKLLFVVLVAFALSSCRSEYKRCECVTDDPQLQMYNEVLTDIIEHHFYNAYLGEDWFKVVRSKGYLDYDSAKIGEVGARLQNKLFNDTARFRTIYLDTVFRTRLTAWERCVSDTSRCSFERKLVKDFSADGQEMMDSLNYLQGRYKSSNFHLCIAKIRSVTDTDKEIESGNLGRIGLSKIFLNAAKTKGVLQYNIYCGYLCGKGAVAVIEKVNGHWEIMYEYETWVS